MGGTAWYCVSLYSHICTAVHMPAAVLVVVAWISLLVPELLSLDQCCECRHTGVCAAIFPRKPLICLSVSGWLVWGWAAHGLCLSGC